jgi:DNA-binding MarR family transcriptional regulator
MNQTVCLAEHLVYRASANGIVFTDDSRSRAGYDGEVRTVREPGVADAVVSDCTAALAGDLGWGLGVVFRGYVAAARAAISDVPGGPRGYQILSAAAKGTVGSQLALAQHLGVDRTVMTYLLDDLEAAGLIQRRPDPVDRRARQVVATTKGSKLLVKLDERLREAEARLLAPLDERARRTFRASLDALATRINTIDPVDNPCDLADAASTVQ